MPTRWPQLGLSRRDPQPDQCLADCTVDVARTRIGVRLKDHGDTLGEGGTERGLELRRGREIEGQLGLRQGHGNTSTGSIASAGNSVRCGTPKTTRRAAA